MNVFNNQEEWTSVFIINETNIIQRKNYKNYKNYNNKKHKKLSNYIFYFLLSITQV